MDDDLRPVPKHELRFDIEHALRKARSLWPRKHVHGDHNALRPVADAVVPDMAIDTADILPDLAAHRIFVKLESLGFIR